MNPVESANPIQAPLPQTSTLSPLGQLLSNARWVQGAEIITVFSPVLFAILLARWMQIENPLLHLGFLWIANILMLLLIACGIKLRGETVQSIGLFLKWPGWGGLTKTVLKAIVVLIFALLSFGLGTALMAGMPAAEEADMTRYNYLKDNLPMLLLSLAGVYVVSSFGEEVIYRGFLITRMNTLFGQTSKASLVAAVVAASLWFGLAHFEWGITGVVQTTLMGAAFGVSFLITRRRLGPLIVAHGIMDTLLLVQLYQAP